MRYNIGDKIKIRKDLVGGQYYNDIVFHPTMLKYLGKHVEVYRMIGNCYIVNDFELNTEWWFPEDMVESFKFGR